MGRTAAALHAAHVHDEGGFGVDVTCDPGGIRNATVALYTPPGIDAMPLPGDTVALEDTSGLGCEMGVGCGDTANAGVTAPGEIRLYARDSSGAVMGDLWLKGDGTIVGANGGGTLTLSPAGVLSVAGSSDAAARASALDTLLVILKTWVPVPLDGGAALKTLLTAAFPDLAVPPTPPVFHGLTSASTVLKVGG